MLKSGGKNGTSFLNSRKVKSVLSAFYCWRVASKFQEKGGILDFLPRKLFSFPWNLNSFPCNFFFVRWNCYFLGHFFDYKLWFLHKSAQFSSERREIPKKTSRFPAKTSRSCEIQKLWESIISDKLFWSYKWHVKLGGQNGESFLSTEGFRLILFSISRFHPLNISSKRTFLAITHSNPPNTPICQFINPLYAPIHQKFQAVKQEIRLNPNTGSALCMRKVAWNALLRSNDRFGFKPRNSCNLRCCSATPY